MSRDERPRRTQGQGCHWYNKRTADDVEPWKPQPVELLKERLLIRKARLEAAIARRNHAEAN